MHIVIAGAGEFGRETAKVFSERGHDVSVIERNAERADLVSRLDVSVIIGDVLKAETLIDAGIDRAQLFIATTSWDDTNVLCGFIVGQQYPEVKVAARIRHLQIGGFDKVSFKTLNIDFAFNPERLAVLDLLSVIESPGTFDVIRIFGGSTSIKGYVIHKDSFLVGKKVQDIISEHTTFAKMLFLSILRDETIIFPGGDTVINENDKLYILGLEEEFDQVRDCFTKFDKPVKNVFIVGISKFTEILVNKLVAKNYSIKIFEKDTPLSRHLAEKYTEVEVLDWQPNDMDLMLQEGLLACDCFIANSEDHEINLLSCLIAKRYNIRLNIIYSDNKEYFPFILNAGIDVIVSPRLSAMGSLHRLTQQGNIQDTIPIFFGNAELIKISISGRSRIRDQFIRDIPLPKGCIIAIIFRGGVPVIPKGETRIVTGDTVFFLTYRKNITDIEKLA